MHKEVGQDVGFGVESTMFLLNSSPLSTISGNTRVLVF